ncbi:MAG: PAS domain S-box protein [Chitinophagaceae bacterium]|nr:MAG: PAS domain S-box protein [Chitinophagaceae bacterium]
MQRIKLLCDSNDRKTALALIGTDETAYLSDSIIKINNQISDNIRKRLNKSQSDFVKVNSRNDKLGYTVIIVSMILIIFVFHFLIKETSKTKKISKELREEKENYRITLNSLAEGLITTNKEGHVVYMNPSAERLTGWNWREAKKQQLNTVFNVVNEETGKPVENIVSRIMNDGKKIEWENNTLLKSKDSGAFIISNNGSPLLDLNGSMTGVVLVFDDITERKKAEKKIKQLSVAVEQSPASVVITDLKGNIQYVNQKFINVTGYSAEDVMGKNSRILKSGYTSAAEYENLWKRITSGLEWRGELHNKKKNGEFYWELALISPIINAKGEIISFLAVKEDITERKKTEEKILKSEEQYRDLVDNITDLICTHDLDGKVLSMNSAAEKLTGFKFDPQQTMNIKDLLASNAKSEFDDYMTGIKKNGFGHGLMKIKTHSGKIRIWEYNNSLKTTGVSTAIVRGYARDITEQKKAEKELKKSEARLKEAQIIAHISNWEIDFVSNTQTWSDEFYRIYGISKAEVQPSTELFLSFMHPEDAGFAQKKVQEGFDSLKDSSFNFRFIRKDGATRHGYSEWRFEFDKKGNPLRLYGILQDITDRKEAEEKLKLLEQKILEQKIQEQKNIAKAIIKAEEKERNHMGQELHDNVNQILAGTKMYLGMVGKDDEKTKASIKYPMELIDNAINEIRSISHRNVTPQKNIDLIDLLQSLFDKLEKNSGLKTELKFDLSDPIKNDDLVLNIYRIIQEEINNILKHAAAKNVSISLETIDNRIQIITTDDGKGFNLNKIRNGIGISNMINRIETFNGKMEIISSPGNGCEIMIEIPF